MTLGERIIQFRTQRGLSRAALARLVVNDVGYTALQRIEKNVTHSMLDEHIVAISRALGVTPAELRGETTALPPDAVPEVPPPVVAAMMRLPPQDRAALLRFIEATGGSGSRIEGLVKSLDAAVRRTRKDDRK